MSLEILAAPYSRSWSCPALPASPLQPQCLPLSLLGAFMLGSWTWPLIVNYTLHEKTSQTEGLTSNPCRSVTDFADRAFIEVVQVKNQVIHVGSKAK